MTIFEKLNEARLRFQNAGVKKSGNNKFAGYTYYELADILPEINKLANELKFCCVVNFTDNKATLDFCDLEKDERITFTSPFERAEVKGANSCQQLGAGETYIKRYLYLSCFEIVEADIVDAMPLDYEENAEDLIKKVKAMMNTFDDKQLDYANKAINTKDVKMLKIIIASKK